MDMPVVYPAKTATVDTHAWTKLHTQIMGWISSVYECAVYAWPYLNHRPQFTPLQPVVESLYYTNHKPCMLQLQSSSLQITDVALWL